MYYIQRVKDKTHMIISKIQKKPLIKPNSIPYENSHKLGIERKFLILIKGPCYGLNCMPSKFVCWSTNLSISERDYTLETESFER